MELPWGQYISLADMNPLKLPESSLTAPPRKVKLDIVLKNQNRRKGTEGFAPQMLFLSSSLKDILTPIQYLQSNNAVHENISGILVRFEQLPC